MSDELAKVIRDANIARELAGGDDAQPPIPFETHIAAAVRAHLTSAASVERAAQAVFLEGTKGHAVTGSLTEDYRNHFRRWSRAALDAAVGGEAPDV